MTKICETLHLLQCNFIRANINNKHQQPQHFNKNRFSFPSKLYVGIVVSQSCLRLAHYLWMSQHAAPPPLHAYFSFGMAHQVDTILKVPEALKNSSTCYIYSYLCIGTMYYVMFVHIFWIYLFEILHETGPNL